MNTLHAPENFQADLRKWLIKLRTANSMSMQSFYDGLLLGKIGTLMTCNVISFPEYQNLHSLRENAIEFNNKDLNV